MGTFLNARRLRDYPRLFLFTTYILLVMNVVFGRGWLGASGQLIGTDFVMLYSGGALARQDPSQLYNFDQQTIIQQELVQPTQLWGLLPYNYPPYVAFIIQPLTRLPMAWALGLWTLATILMGIAAASLLYDHLANQNLKSNGLSRIQLIIITLSFFPFVEGLLVGQNHGLTLLLTTGILVCMQKERWELAGICAGLSVYKPQFALGFILLWLVWGKWRALAGYGITAMIWIGGSVLAFGTAPYLDYISKMDLFLKMLYIEGFGTNLEVTPYGLLVSLLPASAWGAITIITQAFTLILAIGLVAYSWTLRVADPEKRYPAVVLALLFPLLAAPHTLLHDLVILVPALLLWACWRPWRRLVVVSAVAYLAVFLLPWFTYASGIPILALIPLALFVLLINQVMKEKNPILLERV